jgi:hypothetical protein
LSLEAKAVKKENRKRGTLESKGASASRGLDATGPLAIEDWEM